MFDVFPDEVERCVWQLAVQVGSQSISPLFWALRRCQALPSAFIHPGWVLAEQKRAKSGVIRSIVNQQF